MSKRNIKIGKISKLNLKSLSTSDCFDNIKYLDTGNITKNNIINLQILKTKKDKIPSRAKRRVKKNTIIYSTVRPNQEHYGFLENPENNLIVSTWFTTIDIIDENIDPKFIYYLLIQKQITEYLHTIGMSATSSYPSIKPEDIWNLKFKIPEKLEDQQKIASVLSNIDAKIELNNKINCELEAMAKTLYDYWFVQFDFPDENWKPYKSNGGKMVWSKELKREIPEGWEVKRVGDLLPVITWKQDANFATEKWKYKFFTCWEENLKCDIYEFEWKSILVAWNWKINVKFYEWKFNAYQRTYVLIPNEDKYYTIVYLAVKDSVNHLINWSNWSIVKFIRKWDIENIQLALPKTHLENQFLLLNNITNKIEKNIKENDILTELRDWLLPMLMNGQVSVE